MENNIHEPFLYFAGKVGIFIFSITSIFVIAVLGGCKLKGACAVPIELYIVFCIPQWITVSIIINHNLLVARIVLLVSGILLLVYSVFITLSGLFNFAQAFIAIAYSAIFGILFSLYVLCSKKLEAYVVQELA